MKQKGEAPSPAEASKVILPTEMTSKGGVKANFDADETRIQVIKGKAGTEVEGSQAEFPPGSLAVDTQVSINTGEQLANEQSAESLGVDSEFESSAKAVNVESSKDQDAQSPFKIAVDVPDKANLLGTDRKYPNLVVVYKIKKSREGRWYLGIFPRSMLTVKKGQAQFETLHFGTFQAALTSSPITQNKRVEQQDEPPRVPLTYFVRGMRSASFNERRQESGGLQGWVATFAPGRVGQNNHLTTGYTAHEKE